MPNKRNSINDLKGASRLTKDGVTGIIDIVEAIHYNIESLGGFLGRNKHQRTSGITGLVYNNIRAITNLSGAGIDSLLEKLTLSITDKEPSPEHEALLSVINGVLGDYLEEQKNPLAISMQFRQGAQPMSSFNDIINQPNQKIALLIHGSCMNDLQWNRKDHDHGKALAKDLGYTPIYLLYNSGRHISENGKSLADLLEKNMSKLQGIINMIILAHSMGGLVFRSAFHYGKLFGHSWMNLVNKTIYLGTPHHGAPLEQGGNWIGNLLETNSYSAPLSKVGKIRSAGITDLRYGNIVDEDWNKHDRFAPSGDQRQAVPLPIDVQNYAIAATISDTSIEIGDGLVPVRSALGKHKDPHLNLSFPRENQWIGRKMKHLDLLNHPDLYTMIKNWIKNKE